MAKPRKKYHRKPRAKLNVLEVAALLNPLQWVLEELQDVKNGVTMSEEDTPLMFIHNGEWDELVPQLNSLLEQITQVAIVAEYKKVFDACEAFRSNVLHKVAAKEIVLRSEVIKGFTLLNIAREMFLRIDIGLHAFVAKGLQGAIDKAEGKNVTTKDLRAWLKGNKND